MRILITGGLGFIGTNLLDYMLKKYPNYIFGNIDKYTYASNEKYSRTGEYKNYSFYKVDLTDAELLKDVIYEFRPNHIIHLAAESHVDNSLKRPKEFVLSNVLGTQNLLNATYNFWLDENMLSESNFVHISTDEVYGDLRLDEDSFTEESNISPNSPYSASKAASDHLVRVYNKSFNMNCIITRCSNNYGPYQHLEKLIPKTIKSLILKEPITIYGSGKNIRDWLYVKDHCSAIDSVFRNGKPGDVYNIGTQNELSNIQLLEILCDLFSEMSDDDFDYKSLITYVRDRAGHDLRYSINPNKINSQLNWKAESDFLESLKNTIEWYLINLKERL